MAEGRSEAIHCDKKHLTIGREVSDKARDGGADGNFGTGYRSLDNQLVIEYTKT